MKPSKLVLFGISALLPVLVQCSFGPDAYNGPGLDPAPADDAGNDANSSDGSAAAGAAGASATSGTAAGGASAM